MQSEIIGVAAFCFLPVGVGGFAGWLELRVEASDLATLPPQAERWRNEAPARPLGAQSSGSPLSVSVGRTHAVTEAATLDTEFDSK